MLATGALLATSANAQPSAENEGKPAAKSSGERPSQPGPGERLKRMREFLGLTDEQVEKLKPILAKEFEEMRAKMKELGKDAAPEDRRAAMEGMRERYQAQIGEILTAEQKAKVAKMRDQRPRGPGGPGRPSGSEGKGPEKMEKE